MVEQQKHPERTRESDVFSLLAASYEFSQKDGKLQVDLMRVFRHLNPTLQVTEAQVERFVTEGEATRTDYNAQQQSTIAMRMVKMINNARAHKQLESGLASMRLEIHHWKDYLGAFMDESADDPFPTNEGARDFILKLIAQDEHYATTGRERNHVRVFFDYFVEHIVYEKPLPSGNVSFSKNTLPRFRSYIHAKLQEMPHGQFVQIRIAFGRLIDIHNTSSPASGYNKKELLGKLEAIRHAVHSK